MIKMTNLKKYELILKDLKSGKSQSDITVDQNCSYGTITRAKKWELDGKPRKNSRKPKVVVVENSSSENSKMISGKKALELLGKIKESSSSENIVVENSSSIIENAPKSRLLSYLAGCLDIEGYYNMSKKQLKEKIHKKIDSI